MHSVAKAQEKGSLKGHNQLQNAEIGSTQDNVQKATFAPTNMSPLCVDAQKEEDEEKQKEKEKADPQEAKIGCPQEGHAADQQTDHQEVADGNSDLQMEQECLQEELDILPRPEATHQDHHMAQECRQVARTGDPHAHHHTHPVADGLPLHCTPRLPEEKEARKEIGKKEIFSKEKEKGKAEQVLLEEKEVCRQGEEPQMAKTTGDHAKPSWQVIVVQRSVIGGIQKCAISSSKEIAKMESNAPSDTPKVRHTHHLLVSQKDKEDQKDQQM